MLKITLKKSLIGYEKSQRLTANALGLGKIGSTVTQPNNEAIRGMVFKLKHVLGVEDLPEAKAPTTKKGKGAKNESV
jgi:large subunit ribosomal protein L30